MTEPPVTIREMATSIPLLRALIRSGDYPFAEREWERAERDFLALCVVAENAHDYLNLVRPAHMDHAEWESLKALHVARLRESLSYFAFA